MSVNDVVDILASELRGVPRMEQLTHKHGKAYALSLMEHLYPKGEFTVRSVESKRTSRIIVELKGATPTQLTEHLSRYEDSIQVVMTKKAIQVIWHKHILNRHVGHRHYRQDDRLATGGISTVIRVNKTAVNSGVVNYRCLADYLINGDWIDSLSHEPLAPIQVGRDISELFSSMINQISYEHGNITRTTYLLMILLRDAVGSLGDDLHWYCTPKLYKNAIDSKTFFAHPMSALKLKQVFTPEDMALANSRKLWMVELMCSIYINLVRKKPTTATIKGNQNAQLH